MNESINKNISIWRGDTTPPTEYHLWVNEQGNLLIKRNDQDWVQLASPEDKPILDNLQELVESIKETLVWE